MKLILVKNLKLYNKVLLAISKIAVVSSINIYVKNLLYKQNCENIIINFNII